MKIKKTYEKIIRNSIAFFYYNSNACTCIGINSVIREVDTSDIIISGKVISENVFTVKEWFNKWKLQKIEYKILITKIFKGFNTSDTLQIITGLGNGDCGIVELYFR